MWSPIPLFLFVIFLNDTFSVKLKYSHTILKFHFKFFKLRYEFWIRDVQLIDFFFINNLTLFIIHFFSPAIFHDSFLLMKKISYYFPHMINSFSHIFFKWFIYFPMRFVPHMIHLFSWDIWQLFFTCWVCGFCCFFSRMMSHMNNFHMLFTRHHMCLHEFTCAASGNNVVNVHVFFPHVSTYYSEIRNACEMHGIFALRVLSLRGALWVMQGWVVLHRSCLNLGVTIVAFRDLVPARV